MKAYPAIFIRALLATIVLFWFLMQPKLWLGEIIGFLPALFMMITLFITFFVLIVDSFSYLKNKKMADVCLTITLSIWVYLYPMFEVEGFKLWVDSTLFAFQFAIIDGFSSITYL